MPLIQIINYHLSPVLMLFTQLISRLSLSGKLNQFKFVFSGGFAQCCYLSGNNSVLLFIFISYTLYDELTDVILFVHVEFHIH